MILVTGANGQLGRRIVEHLFARLGGKPGTLAVSVRDTAKAKDLADRGISVREGNFDRPETLVAAFTGVDRVVLISTDGPSDARMRQHSNAIEAAKRAGVKHIVYTSFIDVAPDSPAEFSAVHRATEAELRASGLKLTILRNPLYADFLPMTVGAGIESGVFHVSAGAGKVSFLTREELAEATAAAALATGGAKEVYELTGAAAHSYAEVAAAVSKVTGKPVRYQAVPEQDYAKALEGWGVPTWMAGALGNLYTAVAQGRFSKVTGDFAAITGHPPRPLDQTVAALFTK